MAAECAPAKLVPMALAPRPALALLGACALALAGRAEGAQDGVSLELRVQRAIERGVAWLVKQQKPDGSWPGAEQDHPGGTSSLAALTLVKSGIGRDEPPVRDALAALKKVVFQSTYSASVYLMLQAALIDKSHTAAGGEGRDCFEFLLSHQQDGVWAYPWGGADMSNTQFALLGLRAGAQLSFEVPEKSIEACATQLFRWQQPDGSFAYDPGRTQTGGVTGATLGGLAILAQLGKGRETIESFFAKHRADIARAETWMEQHFQVARNPYGDRYWTTSFQYANLWGIERWCGFSARTRIGSHDWYREIAAWLVDEQHENGSWANPGSTDLTDTCFALLTLRRASVSAPFELGDTWKKLDQEKQAQAGAPRVLAAPEIPRARDWLVCGPLRDKPGMPQFLDPSALHLDRLHARERTKLAAEEFARVELQKDGWTNLEELVKRDRDNAEWVLACALEWSPPKEAGSEPLAALVWLTFEDGAKVWLDGKLVLEDLRMQSAIEEHTHVALALAPGVHELVVLLGDERGASAFAARFSDAQGKPLPAGFSASAEPPRAVKKR